MKISEYIAALENIRVTQGDLEVYHRSDASDNVPVLQIPEVFEIAKKLPRERRTSYVYTRDIKPRAGTGRFVVDIG